MVVAVLVGFDHVDKQASQVEGVSWRTDLVVNNLNFIVGRTNLKHSLDKVVAVDAEYPSDTHDKVFVQSIGNSLFAA